MIICLKIHEFTQLIKFKDLGSLITSDGINTDEVKQKTERKEKKIYWNFCLKFCFVCMQNVSY